MRPGLHCPACGEKRIDPARDHSLRWLVGHLLDGLLSLDSKLLRSLGGLLFVPGRLTRDHLDGRRMRYLPPLHLFLTVSVVFYLFFQNAFAAPIWVLQANHDSGSRIGNVFGIDPSALIAPRAAAHGVAIAIEEARIAARAAQESKVFLGLLAPVFAIVLQLLYVRRERRFVPHFVTAVHLLSAFLLYDMVFLSILRLLGRDTVSDAQFLPLLAVFLAHVVLALRRIHQASWPATLVKGVAFVAAAVLAIIVYRQAVTLAVAAFT